MFGFLSGSRKLNKAGELLFSALIGQSRQPVFYQEFAVEDTLDGRFDLMSLHMALLLHKLNLHKEEESVPKFKQIVQEIMFDNLDLTVREIGVGDMGVGKKVKVMAEAFYGRMLAYQEVLETKDRKKMQEILERNLYREREMPAGVLEKMCDYVFMQWNHMQNHKIDDILTGDFSFLMPTAE